MFCKPITGLSAAAAVWLVGTAVANAHDWPFGSRLPTGGTAG
jgi:hypothetical protein